MRRFYEVFNVKEQTPRIGATGSTLAGAFPRGKRATAPSGVQVAEIHTQSTADMSAQQRWWNRVYEERGSYLQIDVFIMSVGHSGVYLGFESADLQYFVLRFYWIHSVIISKWGVIIKGIPDW